MNIIKLFLQSLQKYSWYLDLFQTVVHLFYLFDFSFIKCLNIDPNFRPINVIQDLWFLTLFTALLLLQFHLFSELFLQIFARCHYEFKR